MRWTLALCAAVLASACGAGGSERPAESSCLNGIDDNGDGLEDCRDPTCEPVAECVAAAPGFQLGTRLGAGEACPAAFPDADVLVGQGLQAPETCGPCACAMTFTQCYAQMLTYGSTDCSGTPIHDFGQVTSQAICSGASSGTPLRSVFFTDVHLSSFPCQPSNPRAPWSWTDDARFCGTIHLGGGCGSGRVCAPRAATHCAVAAGAQACPAGYVEANGAPWYAAVDDQRVCPCTCGPPSGMSCAGSSIELLASMCAEPATPVTPRTCVPGEFGEEVAARLVGGPGGSCAPSGPGPMTGAAAPAQPQTLCCLP
jgi:hypothetical protein